MSKKTSSFGIQIGALFTSKILFVSIMVLISSFILLSYGTDWTLVLTRVLLGFIGIGLAFALQRIPSVRNALLNMQEDDRTIANHWAQDFDLIRLTWYLRAAYLISAITMIVCVCMVLPYDLQELYTLGSNLGYSGADEATRIRLLDSYVESSWSFWLGSLSLLIYFLTITVEFVATCHIILYRNTPVTEIMGIICKECYKFGTKAAAVGLPIAVGVNMGMAASPLMFKSTIPTNFINTYFPWSQGYGYPLNTFITQTRDVFLSELPNYNPRDLLGPDYILDSEKQDKFIRENIGLIRKKYSLVQLQTMGIDPPVVSNYGTGLTKAGK